MRQAKTRHIIPPKIYSFIIEKANEKMKKKGKFQKYVTYYKAKGSQQYQREPFCKNLLTKTILITQLRIPLRRPCCRDSQACRCMCRVPWAG